MSNTTNIETVLIGVATIASMPADKIEGIADAALYQQEQSMRSIEMLANLTWSAIENIDGGIDEEILLGALDMMRVLAGNATAMRVLERDARLVITRRERGGRATPKRGSADA